MPKLRTLAGRGLACGLVLAATGVAMGQAVQTRETRNTTTTSSGTTTEVRKVSNVIGSTVQLQGGTSYGKIEDVVINDQGCLDYVVISYEDQYVVVPWTVATVNWGRQVVTIDATQEQLRQVTYSRSDWRNFSTSRFNERAGRIFSSRGARGGRGDVNIQRPGAGRDAPGRVGTEGRRDRDRDSTDRPRGEARDRGRDRDQNRDRDRDRPRGDVRDRDRDRPDDRPRGEARDRDRSDDRPRGEARDRDRSDDRPRPRDDQPKSEDRPKDKDSQPKAPGDQPKVPR